MHWYEIKNIDTIDSPALVIYPQRIQENIRLLKSMVNNEVARLRPHVKTNKIAEVCAMMLDTGITKFKCATIAEAEMLAMIKAPDVLLAYQPVGPKAGLFVSLCLQYPATRFSCVIDNIYLSEQLSKLCLASKITAIVFIDLNTDMNRTGVQSAGPLLLYEALCFLPAVNVVGLHA